MKIGDYNFNISCNKYTGLHIVVRFKTEDPVFIPLMDIYLQTENYIKEILKNER